VSKAAEIQEMSEMSVYSHARQVESPERQRGEHATAALGAASDRKWPLWKSVGLIVVFNASFWGLLLLFLFQIWK
jgi:hypothetical protein